ncbi:M protein, serotype 2.1 like [Actinidia chinensis var. chinensis]|uniref:M protein, serotype 2.1 like n=1 Tax=Actinidia chinensis var. chinensis TaxID=1590841 RepID=A0A2R6R971_ACTCC|nr:M protein, serotype 2.1 like [Actinidia chinensis var. chinensis]
MATSAFKSSSRRGCEKKAPIRRSQSVSALSRTRAPNNHNQLDITSDFLNKRENPLFANDPVPVVPGAALTSKTETRRGRSLDTGHRGRSVSRPHYTASQSDVERDSVVSSSYLKQTSLNVSSFKKANVSSRNMVDMPRQSLADHQGAIEHPSHNSASLLICEDGVSTGSLSEAEEKTIKAVCEQMKSFQEDYSGIGDTAANGIYETVRSEVRRAISDIQNNLETVIQRNNATAIAAIHAADIPPDLVNPGAVELVLDIRREYARKLEESQERARKLRADLAVEENRGQELSRILKEILPDPKANNLQKSRPARKNSSERKKMSKRLTEEAMAYFDECVSISTFDSSDFSAAEDPPFNLIGTATPAVGIASLGQGSPSISTSCFLNSDLNREQESGAHALLMDSHMDSGLTASSSSNESIINQAFLRGNDAECVQKLQFSIDQNRTENVGLPRYIWNYMKHIEKEFDKGGINSENLRSSYYDTDEPLHGRAESLLFDRVLLKNRVDSGSLHLCGGGLAISFSPFGAVV